MPSNVTPPNARARTKPGAPANQSQAAKRSSPSASASTGKRLRGGATAVASGSGRSTQRQALSQSTPMHSLSPPVRVAAATVTPSSPLPTTQAPSIGSVASGAPIDQQGGAIERDAESVDFDGSCDHRKRRRAGVRAANSDPIERSGQSPSGSAQPAAGREAATRRDEAATARRVAHATRHCFRRVAQSRRASRARRGT